MIDTQTIQDAARDAAGSFEAATRTDGTRYTRLRDGRPDWVQDLVRHAHAGMLPDDWRFACTHAALDYIADGGDEDQYDAANAFADDYVSVYTADLLAWLGSHAHRPGYCDEAADEYGDRDSDTLSRIRLGQYAEALEVFGLVYGWLVERAEA